MQKKFKPGDTAPQSGQYQKIGPRGGRTHKEITMVKGKIFPPGGKKRIAYKLVDKTKH